MGGSQIPEAVVFMSVEVMFEPDNISVQAEVGESLLTVAQRAGLFIPTGCLVGHCHACEVEIQETGEVCACIAAVPDGYDSLTICLFNDPTW